MSRTKIYLSILIINIIASIAILAIYLIMISSIWLIFIGEISISLKDFLIILFEIIINGIEYSAIFTFISLLFKDVKLSIMSSLLIVIIMFIASTLLIKIATARKYYYSTTYGEEGIIDQTIIGENTNFPRRRKNKIKQKYII